MQKTLSYPRERRKMVQDQIACRGIIDEKILDVFRRVPRHVYVPKIHHAQAYADHPLPIGEGQTISQPYIVALMTSQLALTGDERVLEIGTGSGYQTAILAHLSAAVYSVELIPALSKKAAELMKEQKINNVHFKTGDGSLGWPENAPYDRAIITAAIPALSAEIKEQIVDGGRIIAPVGERWRQELTVWTKKGESFIKEQILPVVFVPLRGPQGWQD